MPEEQLELLWVVVKVESGIPVRHYIRPSLTDSGEYVEF